jgi:LPXTG-motif cell wall-anchored protein
MIHAQYIDSAGDVKWGATGLSIYEGYAFNNVNNPLIVNDGNIGGIVAWSPSDQATGSYYQIKVQGVSHAYQIANLDSGLDSIDVAGNNIEVGTANGLVGNDELVRVTKDSDNTVISDVLTDMVEDHSWNDVRGFNDLAAGKAVITGLGVAPGTAGVHTLYVPFKSGDNQLIICPDANTLAEVTLTCSNQVIFSEGETKVVGGDTVTVTKATIDSQVYWAAAGVSGTGGFSTAAAAELPSTGINQEVLIVVAMLLISLGSLGAVKSLRRET